MKTATSFAVLSFLASIACGERNKGSQKEPGASVTPQPDKVEVIPVEVNKPGDVGALPVPSPVVAPTTRDPDNLLECDRSRPDSFGCRIASKQLAEATNNYKKYRIKFDVVCDVDWIPLNLGIVDGDDNIHTVQLSTELSREFTITAKGPLVFKDLDPEWTKTENLNKDCTLKIKLLPTDAQ